MRQLRACGWVLLGLFVTTSSTGAWAQEAEAPANPVVNRQGPVQLQWNVTGELYLPGLMGLHARANAYLPRLPIYVGAGAAFLYGTSPSHLEGQSSGFLTRNTMGHNVYELRVGLSLDGWTRRQLESYSATTSTGFSQRTGLYGEQVTQTNYDGSYAAYRRYTLFAGYRRRSVDNRCPDDASLPVDCADLAPNQFMLGYLDLFAVDSDHHGGEVKRSKTWDVHMLYTPGNDYSRTSLAKQLGAEVEVTLGGAWDAAIVIGGGWDGELALLTLAMGYGKPSSFLGDVPLNESITR